MSADQPIGESSDEFYLLHTDFMDKLYLVLDYATMSAFSLHEAFRIHVNEDGESAHFASYCDFLFNEIRIGACDNYIWKKNDYGIWYKLNTITGDGGNAEISNTDADVYYTMQSGGGHGYFLYSNSYSNTPKKVRFTCDTNNIYFNLSCLGSPIAAHPTDKDKVYAQYQNYRRLYELTKTDTPDDYFDCVSAKPDPNDGPWGYNVYDLAVSKTNPDHIVYAIYNVNEFLYNEIPDFINLEPLGQDFWDNGTI
ncbi:MAG: hypothetical protein KJ607_10790 [Bacteroidetes bacterium]|nr:hypothetical protein [Bacteroidota bacterium]